MHQPLVAVRQRTSLEPDAARALVAELLSREKHFELDRLPATEGGGIQAHSAFPQARLTQIPPGRLELSLRLQPDAEHTEISLVLRPSQRYLRWRNVLGGVGALLLVLFLVPLLLSAIWQSAVGLVLFGFAEALGYLLLGVVLVRGDVPLKAAAMRLERKLWRTLRRQGVLLIAETEAAASSSRDSVLSSLLALPIALSLLWILQVFGYGWVAVPAFLFLVLPFVLAFLAVLVADRLPFRYQWRVRRIPLAVSWFGFMFVAPSFALGMFWELGHPSPSGLVASALHDLLVYFGLPLAVAGHVMPLQGLLSHADKTRVRYGDVFAAPSGGLEEAVPRPGPLVLFRSIVVLTLALLTVGLVYGGVQWTAEARALAAQPPSVAALGALGERLPPVLVRHAPTVILGALTWPIVLLVGSWLTRKLRAVWALFPPAAILRPVPLDALTRPGLEESLRQRLGVRTLEVVWARARDGRAYGAALQRYGWRRDRCRLYLDRIAFLHLRGALEREAILWHEVGHVFDSRHRAAVLFDVLFLVWAEHARTLLVDSVESELACDRFVYQEMGTVEPLRQALVFFRAATVPVQNDEERGLLALSARLVALVTGAERVSDWHPHVSVRLRLLDALEQTEGLTDAR